MTLTGIVKRELAITSSGCPRYRARLRLAIATSARTSATGPPSA